MRRFLAITTLVAALTAAASAASELPVRTAPLRELRPVVGSGYLAWAQDSRERPNWYEVYVQSPGGRPSRIGRRGRFGIPGGISGTTLVYQEGVGTPSNLRFYDLSRKRQLRVPPGVNTRQAGEAAATLTADYLLFSRFTDVLERVLLRDLRARTTTQLDSGRIAQRQGSRVTAGQINGLFAVWTKCQSSAACTVYRYDTVSKLKGAIAPPAGHIHYAPSVTPDGTVYLARSSPNCGAGAEIWRYPLTAPPTKLFTLPRGYDVESSYALASEFAPVGVLRTSVYYGRQRCLGHRFDLYKFVDVVRQPPPPP
jgi:hypothetical protein